MDFQKSDVSEQIKALDEAFKSYIDDMKPFVLSLSEKKDRQRIAVWIKKLCGPMGLKPLERKNRNLYAQILFQMLRKGSVAEPFSEDPTSGPLQILPAYLTKYLDDSSNSSRTKKSKNNPNAPEWIRGELPSSDSAFSELPYRKSGTGSGSESPTSPPYTRRSTAFKYSNPPKVEYPLGSSQSDDSHDADSLDESSDAETSHYQPSRNLHAAPPLSPVRGRLGDVYGKEPHENLIENVDYRRLGTSRNPANGSKEKECMRANVQELESKIASLEAKLAQEKVILHKEKDLAVQKVLERKNTEIEGIRSHFRNKLNESEETRRRLEKKVSKLTRDLNNAISRNDNEVHELQAIIQQNNVNAEHELERRVQDKIAEFEEEKFAMQKEHARNIQELLNETNERLKKIENEYLQKIESTDTQTKGFENEIYQLKRSIDKHKQEKEDLLAEKGELKERLATCYIDQRNTETRMKSVEKDKDELTVNQDKALRDLRRKTDTTIEGMKKEQANAAAKAAVVISELESKISQCKQSMQDMELQRKRDLREQESSHKQEMVLLEVNHEKMVRKRKTESERMEAELQNKLNIIEQTIKEKDMTITRLTAELSDHKLQAQSAIESFKKQAESNSKKIFQEMKQQIKKVESDLTKAYRENSDQKAKYSEEISSLSQRHERQVTDLKALHTQEKEQLLRDTEAELESQAKEYSEHLDGLKTKFNRRAEEQEDALHFERESSSKKLLGNDQAIKELRDEVIQANSLRKQQLVELGMLRDEEKQSFKRQEESLQAKLRSQLEQQRLALQAEHNAAMEEMLEKTNGKLKEIEQEYTLSLEKSQQRIAELQSQFMEVNERLSREQSQSQMKNFDLAAKYEKEREDLKRSHVTALTAVQQNMELHRTKSKEFERKCYELELYSQESLTNLKLEYEEKVRGLLPQSARMELEETIAALREQIALIQSRASLLQQELDSREGISSENGSQMMLSR